MPTARTAHVGGLAPGQYGLFTLCGAEGRLRPGEQPLKLSHPLPGMAKGPDGRPPYQLCSLLSLCVACSGPLTPLPLCPKKKFFKNKNNNAKSSFNQYDRSQGHAPAPRLGSAGVAMATAPGSQCEATPRALAPLALARSPPGPRHDGVRGMAAGTAVWVFIRAPRVGGPRDSRVLPLLSCQVAGPKPSSGCTYTPIHTFTKNVFPKHHFC